MPLTRRSLLTTTAAGAAVSALAHPTLPVRGQRATPQPGSLDLESALLATIEEHDIPGALALVDSPDAGVRMAAVGVANLETGEPMTTDMHLRIGSITKTFTATMILQLVDQGAMALDDTLADLLPGLSDLPNADTTTIRQLLTMQSGLPDYLTTNEALEASLSPDVDHAYPPDELLGYIADEPAVFAPGEKGMYSNTNYLVLSMVAEHLTGTPWQELIRTGILDEVGLEHTSVPETSTLPDPSPRGYAFPSDLTGPESTLAGATPESAQPIAPDGPFDLTEINPSIPGPAGSMISTLTDLHTWMSVLREGSLLSPDLQKERLDLAKGIRVQGAVGEMTYGLGITEVDGMIGHGGGLSGFRATMYHAPDTETTIVTMTNVLPARGGSDPAGVLMGTITGA